MKKRLIATFVSLVIALSGFSTAFAELLFGGGVHKGQTRKLA